MTEADYRNYRALIATYCRLYRVEVQAYCLLPDQVHIIAVTGRADGVRKALAVAHRYYNRHVNLMRNLRGKLWQGRLVLYPIENAHLIDAVRYVEMLPVLSGLSGTPQDYTWSSARAHSNGADDELVQVKPVLEMTGDRQSLIEDRLGQAECDRFKLHEKSGRPMGSEEFVHVIERASSRISRVKKPGRNREEAQKMSTSVQQRIRE